MLPSVVRYYHTGHPRKKILFEPKSIGCIDKSMHILQQKCIFSWPTIFFTTIWQKQQQSFLRMMESYLLTGWMDEKETWSISILLQKMFFLCPTILFADDGTEPERPSDHHNRPLHYSVVRYFFTLKIQSEMEEAPRYRLFTQLTLLSLLSLLPLIPLLTLFNTLFK